MLGLLGETAGFDGPEEEEEEEEEEPKRDPRGLLGGAAALMGTGVVFAGTTFGFEVELEGGTVVLAVVVEDDEGEEEEEAVGLTRTVGLRLVAEDSDLGTIALLSLSMLLSLLSFERNCFETTSLSPPKKLNRPRGALGALMAAFVTAGPVLDKYKRNVII